MGSLANKVQVLCRIRPFLKSENADNSVTVEGTKTVKVYNHRDTSKELHFTFDACFDSSASQKKIYFPYIKNLVDTVFDGQSATIFCYGVTGAGKTFTIQGDDLNLGIIPRAMMQIFSNSSTRNIKLPIKLSYYEVFKENVYDLLRERDSGPGLPIREDSNRRVFVAGLKEELLNNFEDFKKLFNVAIKRRRTASTRLNANSSRSHAVLVIKLCCESKSDSKMYEGQLNLIDLAGSEDNRKTDNNRERMKESTAINQSLFVLGKVIEALNSGASRIPYRDSKMTRILQDSLGGESKSMMIVNVAPGESFLQDTQKTLNYATKAREVVNKEPVLDPITSSADSNSRKRSLNNSRNNFPGSRGSDANNPKRTKISNDSVTSSNDSKMRSRNISHHNNKNSLSSERGHIVDHSFNNIKNDRSKNSLIKNQTNSAEKSTEKISNEITKRLDRLESKLNNQFNSGSSVIVDSDVLDLISPTTKLKTSKALLIKGKELEKSGNLLDALKKFEQALHYAPELTSLSKHVNKLRLKIQNKSSETNLEKPINALKNDKEIFPIHILQNSLDGAELFSPTINKSKSHKPELPSFDQSIAQNKPNPQSNLSYSNGGGNWKVLASASKKKKTEIKSMMFSLSSSPFKPKPSSLIVQPDSLKNNSLLFNYEGIGNSNLNNNNLVKRRTFQTSNQSNGDLSNKLSESKKLTQNFEFNLKKRNSYTIDSDSGYDSSTNPSKKLQKSSKLPKLQSHSSDDEYNEPKSHNNPALINSINSADLKDLVKLKGVGKKRAMVIRDFIVNNGYIESVYDLVNAGLSKSVVNNILES
ncbi:Kinesin-like protein KIF22-A [Smittium culicis]|uniref:Kinesin-like protein n=1 Tax=Smittium culicis TaxID=133412 RepID=A0A1R1YGW0_9FUNG|nr:Kinesin-like protein KIF22-A [Smittium culicis]